MVDPVLAADGHTYDREQIESWLHRDDHNGQPTSPQTREPLVDTRLLPNLALRRTIQRLVDSGHLDDEIVREWRESTSQQAHRASTLVKDKSLERFPLGAEVEVAAVLSAAGGEGPAGARFLVDVRSYTGGRRAGGGLFGQPPETAPDGRLILESVPASAVLQASRHLSNSMQQHVASFLELFETSAGSLTPAALSVDELQRRVFSSALSSGDDYAEDFQRARADDTLMVVMHMFRRLKSTGNLSDVAGVEFDVLEKELSRRHQARNFQYLISVFGRNPIHLKAVVQDVSDRGEFVLRFESEALEGATTTVPGDSAYIVKLGEVVGSGGLFGANTGGGLFGPNAVGGGGLFGAPAGGGLFGGTVGVADEALQ